MTLIGELDLDLPLWVLPEILITWSPLVKLMTYADTGRGLEREATSGLREGTSVLSAYWGGTETESCGEAPPSATRHSFRSNATPF